MKHQFAKAFNQIQHYTKDIPLLFEYNVATIVSDGKGSPTRYVQRFQRMVCGLEKVVMALP